MRRRHPLLWLMTDERLGEALWPALGRLPRGAGVVFRHHATPLTQRRALFARVARIARRRRLALVGAGGEKLGRDHRLTHGRRGSLTWPAHSRAEAVAAARAGARLLFVSPVFATRSHPGARPLGPLRAATIARGLGVVAIALGGMDARRFRRMKALGFSGWAAIDGLAVAGAPGAQAAGSERPSSTAQRKPRLI